MSTSFQSKIPNSLNEHWMPFSSNKDFKKNPRIIVKAEGIHLHTHDGKTLIDGSSGLYCNPLGHGRKEIIEAIKNQLENLDYTMPFQQGYGGSFELATMIAQKTPEDLNITIEQNSEIIKVSEPAQREAGVKVETVDELVDKLKNEAGVI